MSATPRSAAETRNPRAPLTSSPPPWVGVKRRTTYTAVPLAGALQDEQLLSTELDFAATNDPPSDPTALTQLFKTSTVQDLSPGTFIRTKLEHRRAESDVTMAVPENNVTATDDGSVQPSSSVTPAPEAASPDEAHQAADGGRPASAVDCVSAPPERAKPAQSATACEQDATAATGLPNEPAAVDTAPTPSAREAEPGSDTKSSPSQVGAGSAGLIRGVLLIALAALVAYLSGPLSFIHWPFRLDVVIAIVVPFVLLGATVARLQRR